MADKSLPALLGEFLESPVGQAYMEERRKAQESADYTRTLLENEGLKNDELTEENERLRNEIGRLNGKASKLYLDICKLMEKS